MTSFRCTCVPDGQLSPHSRPEQCRANRAATHAMQSRVFQSGSIDVRDAAGKFVRFATNAEAELPHGTAVEGGTIRRW